MKLNGAQEAKTIEKKEKDENKRSEENEEREEQMGETTEQSCFPWLVEGFSFSLSKS